MTEIELTARLARLERGNRRMKRLALAALVLPIALASIYATRPMPDVIRAREFQAVDADGIVRVRITTACSKPNDCWPAIDLYNNEGQASTYLTSGMLMVSDRQAQATIFGSQINVESRSNRLAKYGSATLAVDWTNQGGSLTLSGKEGMSAMLQSEGSAAPYQDGGTLILSGKGSNSVFASASSPGLQIVDSKGYSMDIGSTALEAARVRCYKRLRLQSPCSATTRSTASSGKRHRISSPGCGKNWPSVYNVASLHTAANTGSYIQFRTLSLQRPSSAAI